MIRRGRQTVPEGFTQADGHVLIAIRLTRLAQLFHSLDPAPFREKDLDPAAETYLIESAEEIGADSPIALVFELPEAEIPTAATLLPEAISHYFIARAVSSRRELNRLLREGRAALVIGLAFLGLCLVASEVMSQWGTPLTARFLGEGLLIVGWVALWRPLEIFLYAWWPLYRRIRVHRRLAKAPVWIRATPPGALSKPGSSG